MKILISSDGPHAHYYIRLGWARAFEACGHNVLLWDVNSIPAFDVFDDFEPDIFMGQTYNLNRSVATCIKERPHLKVVMRAPDWGDMQKEIDKEKYPILTARDDEIKLVEQLKKETGKPDFVHNHYHENWISKTHNKWLDLGIEPVSLLHAADVFEYYGGKIVENFKSDISFIGGYWPYKARCLDKYIVRLCHPVGKFNIKIFGGSDWPVIQYMGRISGEQTKHIFRSAKVCPNISEPHSQDFGYDIIERPFKILMSGGFCISDYVESMSQDIFTNDEIIFAKTPKEFETLVKYYVNHPEEREPYIQRGYRCVLEKHTYFHRICSIFNKLGLDNEAETVTEALEEMMV
ncbi:hypothetical protein CL634_08860 [bacterium]|nr:hypothetical protein [bacterium]